MPRLYSTDWNQYREHLALYYSTRRLDPSLRDEHGDLDPARYRARVRSHHQREDWRFELIEDLRGFAHDRRVLELGCGYGYWTLHLAEAAKSVLATDVSRHCLARAKKVVSSPNASFAELDAYEVEDARGDFDTVVTLNMINHFPLAVAREVMRRIHRRLGTGARVFVAGEHYYGWRAVMYPKGEAALDLVSARLDAECGPVEIVDNPFTPEQVRQLVGPSASDLFVGDSLGFWWARYSVGREKV